MGSMGFFNVSDPLSHAMFLGFTQVVTKIGTRDLLGGKGRPASETDLTAICEATV
jgi:ABC-type tungstate transport system substrate-binding protein